MKSEFDDLVKNFQKYLEGQNISKRSLNFYVSDIRVFVRWVFQHQGQSSITKESFENYAQYIKDLRLPVPTINRKLSSLRRFSAFMDTNQKSKQKIYIKNSPINNNYQSNYFVSFFQTITPTLTLFFTIVIVGLLLINERGQNTNLISAPKTSSLPVSFTPENKLENLVYLPPIGRGVNIEDSISVFENTNVLLGRDEIPKRVSQKTIFIPGLKESSFVFITQTSNVETASLFVSSVKEGEFTISLSKKAENETKFNWLVVKSQFPLDTN